LPVRLLNINIALTESTLDAKLGQETIVTTQPLPLGLHCDG